MQGGTFSTLLLLAATITLVSIGSAGGSFCEPGRTWWDVKNGVCANCTLCDASKAYAVLRPCEVHQDTLCAPLGELDIDWSWIPRSQNDAPIDEYRVRAKRLQYKNRGEKPLERIFLRNQLKQKRLEKSAHGHDVKRGLDDEELQKQNSVEGAIYNGDVKIENGYVYLSEGFAWDWQTSTLLLATVTCIIFFIIVAFYSIYHTRQWRQLRSNIRADIESLPVKLNLILTAKEIISESEASTPEHDRHYSNIQCSYLEKLLAQNNKLCKGGPGNVYIRTADK